MQHLLQACHHELQRKIAGRTKKRMPGLEFCDILCTIDMPMPSAFQMLLSHHLQAPQPRGFQVIAFQSQTAQNLGACVGKPIKNNKHGPGKPVNDLE
jgi:hypothetical protein